MNLAEQSALAEQSIMSEQFAVQIIEPAVASTRFKPQVSVRLLLEQQRELWNEQNFKLVFYAFRQNPVNALSSRGYVISEYSDEIRYRQAETKQISATKSEVYGVIDFGDYCSIKTGEVYLQAELSNAQLASRSNLVRLNFLGVTQSEQPLAGFIYPATNGIYVGRYLEIRGWALARNSVVKQVELFLDEVPLGKANIGIWDPYIGATLPDAKHANRGVFSLTLDRQTVLKNSLTASCLKKPHALKAKIVFENQVSMWIEIPLFIWQAAQEETLAAGLDSISYTAAGLLCLEGWVSSPSHSELQIFLDGAYKSICLYPNAEFDFNWTDRPEIDQQYLLNASSQPTGFKVRLHPLALGKQGGYPRLRVHQPSTGKLVTVRNKEFASSYRKLSQRFVDHAKPLLSSLLAIVGLPSRFGFYKPYARLDKPQVERTTFPKTMLVCMHNLSATEGAPKVLANLLTFLKAKQQELKILVVSAQDGALRQEFEALEIQVKVMPELSMVGQTWERYQQARILLEEYVRQLPQVLVYANVLDTVWGIDSARRLNLPAIWSIHESVNPLAIYPELDPRLRMQLLMLLEYPALLLFVAKSTQDLFDNYRSNAKQVIPNGVDLSLIEANSSRTTKAEARKKLGIAEDARVVLIVGTTTHRKGQDVFVREMILLADKQAEQKFCFIIVGARAGDFLQALEDQVAQSSVSQLFRFVPETPDVAPYYIAADVAVVASREESAPLVSLEAFAFGVPLVSTTCYGLAEQIRTGKNALAFDIERVGDLAQNVEQLLGNPALAESLVAEARKDVKTRFSQKDSLAKYEAAIQQVWEASNE